MSASRPTPPLSLAALTVLELSPVQMVDCAAQAGYAHVGLRLLPATPTESTWPIVGDTPMIRDVIGRLAGTGMQVLDIEILRLKPDTVVRDYLPVLETGARLGARHVLIAGNDPDRLRLAANFAALAELAHPLGLSLAIEFMPWCDVATLTDAADVIARAGAPNAGILVDAIHFDRARHVPADLRGMDPALFPYMQLCDAPAERPTDAETLLYQARAARMMPGDGGLDLVGLLSALPPGRPIALEVPMLALAQTVPALERAQRLRMRTLELLQKMDARALHGVPQGSEA